MTGKVIFKSEAEIYHVMGNIYKILGCLTLAYSYQNICKHVPINILCFMYLKPIFIKMLMQIEYEDSALGMSTATVAFLSV